jgi:hypothetical protein
MRVVFVIQKVDVEELERSRTKDHLKSQKF